MSKNNGKREGIQLFGKLRTLYLPVGIVEIEESSLRQKAQSHSPIPRRSRRQERQRQRELKPKRTRYSYG
jgi:hypothetical protein